MHRAAAVGARNGHPVFDSGTRPSIVQGAVATLLVLVATGGLLAVLLLGSFEDAGAWQALIEDRDFLHRLAFSLAQAAAATTVGLAVGLPASWFLSRGSLPARGLLALLVAAPLAIPGVVLGLGVDLIADGEVVPRALVIIAHAIIATSAVAWIVTPAWTAGDPHAAEDARLLGAGPLRAYLAGTGRHVPGAVRVAASLAFWYAFAAAGAVAILGGASASTTESVLAFGGPVSVARPTVEGVSIAQQSALALVQVLVGMIVLTLGGLRWPAPTATRPRAGRGVAVLGTLYLLALVVTLWAPLGWVVDEAAAQGALGSLSALRDLGSTSVGGRDVTSLLAWTGVLAGLSAVAATLVAWLGSGLIATRGGTPQGVLARWAVALPAALTGAALGWAGLLLAGHLGADLDRTYVLAVGAHALLAYPFALRILGAPRSVSRALLEDALVLGRTARSARWRWVGRRTAMAFASAFLIAAVISAGEVAAANLLTPRDATPAALGLLRGWAAGGSVVTGEVYALGAVLAGVTVVAFACAEWLRRAASRVEAG